MLLYGRFILSPTFAGFFNHDMPNRKTPPIINQVQNLHLPPTGLVHLDNGVPVHILHSPVHQVLKVELLFWAGRPEESKRMVSRATSRLLREGTTKHKGAEIAEFFDFYGASLSVPTNLDIASFSLFAIKKHAPKVLPMFAEVLLDPVFPQAELDTFVRNSVHELQVELEKNEVLAYRKITELIFGENHPYGYNSVPDDYTALTKQDLTDYYEKWYRPSNCLILASGNVDDDTLNLLNQHFGQKANDGQRHYYHSEVRTSKPKRIQVEHEGSLQTAIRIGRRLFNRKHPDYDGVFVLNTILGGYFGSRLMMDIREKKGYTYNIYSTADAMLYDGCMYIAAEVNPDKAEATIRAIFAQMKKLREQMVDVEELDMVKNYLLGMLLNGLDGPINSSEILRNLLVEDLPLSAFEQLVHTILHITPEKIQELANQYLKKEDFWVVLVG